MCTRIITSSCKKSLITEKPTKKAIFSGQYSNNFPVGKTVIPGYLNLLIPKEEKEESGVYVIPASDVYSISIETNYSILPVDPDSTGTRVITRVLTKDKGPITEAVWSSHTKGRYHITTFSSVVAGLRKEEELSVEVIYDNPGDTQTTTYARVRFSVVSL